MSLLRPLRIGDVCLENNLMLSPMAGYSDIAFRALCRQYGAGLVCTEMVAAPSALAGDRIAARKMTTRDAERPVSIQVFGREPDEVAQAAKRVEDACDIIGFNLGCPAPQIKHAGCGAALLDDPDRAVALVSALRAATERPLLVKMRTGNDSAHDVGAFGRRLVEAGADALILHGRTAAQMYAGHADWDQVRRLREAVDVPVIGNGDVHDGPSAERALRASGADGLAIGRAALGNPRVFADVQAHLAAGQGPTSGSPAERAADFRAYVTLAVPHGIPLQQIRNQATRFARGFPGARALRTRMNTLRSPGAVVAAVDAAARTQGHDSVAQRVLHPRIHRSRPTQGTPAAGASS